MGGIFHWISPKPLEFCNLQPKKEFEMKHTGWIWALAVGALLLMGVAGVLVWMQRPMGPPLALNVPVVEVQPAVEDLALSQQRQTGAAAPAAAQEKAQQPKGPCNAKGLQRLLVIGRASPIEAGMYGADAIRLAVVDYDRGRAAILALPVQLWVDTPALAGIGVEETSLNLAYQKAWETAHGNPDDVRTQKATQALAQTILDNFAFVPDHYITVEEAAFVRYVDTLGGINITLAQPVDGTSEGYGVYAAGPQLLDGARTLNLTRLLHPSGQPAPDTWGSLSRQDLVMKGLLATALKPENWDKAPDLVKEIRQAITTDLSASQALDLACMAQAAGGQAALLVVEPEMVTYQDGHMLPDLQAIHQLIQQMEAGS